LEPPLILICPSLTSTSWPRVAATGLCCVNLLAQEQTELARQFAASATDKYRGIAWSPAPESGSPVIEGVLAWIDCQIQNSFPGGDHLIVVCRVVALGAYVDRHPLIFYRAGFGRMI
jgi:flavin reductase (DIM6/NTAB) family NADH-FMN oxidoreductase RutF